MRLGRGGGGGGMRLGRGGGGGVVRSGRGGGGGGGSVRAGKEEYAGQQARMLPAVQATLPEPVVQVEVGSGPSQQDTREKIEVLKHVIWSSVVWEQRPAETVYIC